VYRYDGGAVGRCVGGDAKARRGGRDAALALLDIVAIQREMSDTVAAGERVLISLDKRRALSLPLLAPDAATAKVCAPASLGSASARMQWV
jgi:hypothetical protein